MLYIHVYIIIIFTRTQRVWTLCCITALSHVRKPRVL